jgi:hypothetical protein
MQGTAEMLTAFETCPRQAWWRREWERTKMGATQMLQAGVCAAMLEAERKDWGEVAGETVYALGAEPGLLTEHYDVHSEVIHLAAIADVVASAVRPPGSLPWLVPESLDGWEPSCFLSPDGLHLRRIVFASSWNDDRHYSVCRSWPSLGPVSYYKMPMQIAVVILGQHRGGKYFSSWSRGLLHPMNKKLRFRKKRDIAAGFKASWEEVWREDHAEISTEQWLQAMLEDGALADACFSVDIAVPEKPARDRIVDMAKRKLDRVAALTELPDPQLTGCDWPAPCIFRDPCHAGREPREGLFKILTSSY